ncbi:MAG: 4Fe-4S ferredoxin [Anaerolineae bacterium]
MTATERLLRDTARSLLAEKKVDLVIGYEQGTLPLRTTPCFIRNPDEAERLVWNRCCENNLARYLRDRRERIGLVAKGCDARSLVMTINERQLARENVFIIAVPCRGILDRGKIERQLGWQEILAATLADEQVIVAGEGFEERLSQEDFLCEQCLVCEQRTPSVYDVLVGEPVPAAEGVDPFQEVRALEARSAAERWAIFSQEFARCIRCYACRQACPLCYCKECFVDQGQPCWVGKSDDPSDVLLFQIVRMLHIAGRCADCGACDRACPMGIDLRALTSKVSKDIREWYGYQAGIDIGAIPPLATFQPDDPQEFIKS